VHPLRWIIGGAAALAALATVGVLAMAAIFGSMASGGPAALAIALAESASDCISPAATQPAWGQWSAEQVTNAATIVRVGQSDSVPQYGWIIAVATAMQESSLINLNHGDGGSLGLFQQIPADGWGTPAQIMDPVYASGQFYAHLMAVPGWQQMPLTVAAQAVQRSANPDAYAKWQGPATSLVNHLAPGASPVTLPGATPVTSSCGPGQVLPGSTAQIRAVLAYAYSALGTLYDYGGTCTGPHSPDMALHCDCSSLVQQSFLHGAGLQLPRTAEAQWQWGEDGHGMVIPLSQAQPGDVVYFPSYLGPNIIGHTGIITDPQTMTMINAPDTGKPVGFAGYNPAGLPYGAHMFTILRFINAGASTRSKS
jgi:cell wall-associated NlpC family hydrolase